MSDTPVPSGNDGQDKALEQEKLRLERDKLKLEIEQLRFSASGFGKWLDVLKAAAAPVALVGAVIAGGVGLQQARVPERHRLDDLLASGVKALSSDNLKTQLSGISVLGRFLTQCDSDQGNWLFSGPSACDREYRSASLRYLIDAMGIKQDTIIQDAIIENFESLSRSPRSGSSLDPALEQALRYNRSITKKIKDESRLRHDQYLLDGIRRILGPDKTAEATASTIYLLERDMTRDQFLELHSVGPGASSNATDDERGILHSLGRLISVLVQKGAASSDFSSISCESCDFSSMTFRARTDFSDSILSFSNFVSANLRSAIFDGSFVGGANFFGADLSGARFSSDDRTTLTESIYQRHREPFLGRGGRFGPRAPLETSLFPNLNCSDLSGAVLDSWPLFFAELTRNMSHAPSRLSVTIWRPIIAKPSSPVIFHSPRLVEVDQLPLSFTGPTSSYFRPVEQGGSKAADPKWGEVEDEVRLLDSFLDRCGGLGLFLILPSHFRTYHHETAAGKSALSIESIDTWEIAEFGSAGVLNGLVAPDKKYETYARELFDMYADESGFVFRWGDDHRSQIGGDKAQSLTGQVDSADRDSCVVRNKDKSNDWGFERKTFSFP